MMEGPAGVPIVDPLWPPGRSRWNWGLWPGRILAAIILCGRLVLLNRLSFLKHSVLGTRPVLADDPF